MNKDKLEFLKDVYDELITNGEVSDEAIMVALTVLIEQEIERNQLQ